MCKFTTWILDLQANKQTNYYKNAQQFEVLPQLVTHKISATSTLLSVINWTTYQAHHNSSKCFCMWAIWLRKYGKKQFDWNKWTAVCVS